MQDTTIIKVREIGLNAINKMFACVSVELEFENQIFTVYKNGDVDAPDGFRYSQALIAKNGLVVFA